MHIYNQGGKYRHHDAYILIHKMEISQDPQRNHGIVEQRQFKESISWGP